MAKGIKWSLEQEKAIYTTGTNILVSANAGSGKTAVLTERIYQLLINEKESYDISRFLILTFTNPAAKEMKDRVRNRLLKDERFKSQASKIESSHIETFDSFCLFLVKKYAKELNIKGEISNLDGTLYEIKLNSFVEEVMGEYASSHNDVLCELYKNYAVKNSSKLKTLLLKFCKLANLQLDRDSFLNGFSNEHYDKEKIDSYIEQERKRRQEIAHDLVLALEEYAPNNIEEWYEYLSKYQDCQTYDSLFNYVRENKTPRLKDTTGDNFYGRIKRMIEKLNFSKDSNFGTSADIKKSYLETKKYSELYIEMAKAIFAKLDAFENKYCVYSFQDIAHFAIKALNIPEIRNEVRDFFQIVMVDEYQDTSDIQEYVVNAIGNNNIYMVGDVKQSIYKFRNANADIFNNKFNKYRSGNGGIEIDLNHSFRSRQEIIDDINEMFISLMNKEDSSINYQDGHMMRYGLKDYDHVNDNFGYGLSVYRYNPENGKPNAREEASLIAQDIIDSIKKKKQVFFYDENRQPSQRDCTFKDFTVLIDRGTDFGIYKAVFNEYHLPLRVFTSVSGKNSAISGITKNLLKIYRCLQNDDLESVDFVHACLSIGRSFLLEEKDDYLYEQFKKDRFETCEAVQKVRSILSIDQSLFSILNNLYLVFNVEDSISKIGNFRTNVAQINYYLNLAKSMSGLSYSLDEFIKFFDDINDYDLKNDFDVVEPESDSVQLMNIHHSKGLEFPFVYIAGLYKRFNREEFKTSFYANKHYGLVFPLHGVTDLNSFFVSILKNKEIDDDYDEKLRLLYVAFTRARERLTLIMPVLEERKKPLSSMVEAGNYYDVLHEFRFDERFKKKFNPSVGSINKASIEIEKKNFVFEQINVPFNKVEKKKASKSLDEEIDENLLEFGSTIHYLLEIVDYETKDLSFIKDNRIKKYINNVLSQPLFEGVKNSQLKHEFPFFDEINNVHGVIDCLIIKNDHIDIIDFKLKNIEDEKYFVQMNTYYDYINTLTDLPIHMYLLSAITGEVKEVERK